jgi:hypothetical protein
MKLFNTLSTTLAVTCLTLALLPSAQALELVKATPVSKAKIAQAAKLDIAKSLNLLPLVLKATPSNSLLLSLTQTKSANAKKQELVKVSIIAE